MAELYKKVLRSNDHQLLRSLKEILSHGFYMAGGTALALQIGHRLSEDFDFFSDREYSNETLKIQLNRIGSFHLFQDSPGTLEGRIDETRVTFLYYPYPRLEKGVTFESVGLASLLDIALMKLSAVSSRGSRKDFIDLYFLRNTYPVEDVSAFFDRKYRDSGTNWYHIIKSLAFFEDADKEPMPKMLQQCDWEDVKAYFNEVQLKLADRYL